MAKFRFTHELCPHCDSEVKILNKFQVQECPECKAPIMPCSICDATNDSIPQPKCSCDKCPLETPEYREKLLNATYNACFSKECSKDERERNMSYLKTLTNIELSIKLSENTDVHEEEVFFVDEEDEDYI
ncbi:MAG TPA: hypothetical protein VK172_10210 [Lentimicrobium sp.]|nr:hypothetical protein [Lentimicrobium sp.]